jgi:hypothetical protein
VYRKSKAHNSILSFKESMQVELSEHGGSVVYSNPVLDSCSRNEPGVFDLEFIRRHDHQVYSSSNAFTQVIQALNFILGTIRAGTIEMSATLGFI